VSDVTVNSVSSLLSNSPSDVVDWYQSLQSKLSDTSSTLESFVKDSKVWSRVCVCVCVDGSMTNTQTLVLT